MRTNADKLPINALPARPRPPVGSDWQVSHDGRPFFSYRTSGITFNVKVGDSAFGWAADHTEPGVSCWMPNGGTSDPNRALQVFSCIGNRVQVRSGDAKGAVGTVTGKHGGIENVIVDFADDALAQLTYEDKLMVIGHGPGLALLDYPTVQPWNLSPTLLDAWDLIEVDGKIEVPVAAIVPGSLMGSGVGSGTPFRGDYDIQTADADLIAEHGLDALRIGDFVAIVDHHATYGWAWKKGSVHIGVVIHGDSIKPGHGPGVTTLLSCTDGTLVPKRTPLANLAETLGIGRARS